MSGGVSDGLEGVFKVGQKFSLEIALPPTQLLVEFLMTVVENRVLGLLAAW